MNFEESSTLIGGNIKKYRQVLNLSQGATARLVGRGVTQGMIWEYEEGTRRIPADILINICEVLRCDPNQVTGFTPDLEEKYPSLLNRIDKVARLGSEHQDRVIALLDAYLMTTTKSP